MLYLYKAINAINEIVKRNMSRISKRSNKESYDGSQN